MKNKLNDQYFIDLIKNQHLPIVNWTGVDLIKDEPMFACFVVKALAYQFKILFRNFKRMIELERRYRIAKRNSIGDADLFAQYMSIPDKRISKLHVGLRV